MDVSVLTNVRPLIQAQVLAAIPEFKEVAGASNLAAIVQGRLVDNGCYIFREKASPEASEMANGVMQRITTSIALVIVVRNVATASGVDADDASFKLQNKLKQALLGWVPEPNASPLHFSGGALVSFANGFHIWKDSYTTEQFIRAI